MSRGVTLLELLLAVALLGLTSGVVALALPSTRAGATAALVAELERARARAVWSGEAVRWAGPDQTVWFWPDGTATPATIGVEHVTVVVTPLTGAISVRR